MTSSEPSAGSAWSALRHPDFRAMYLAQFVSYCGSFMQLAAVNWHVYNLTGSMTALGLVGLVRVLPIILFSLLGGVVADARDRRKLMLFTQSAMLIPAFILALATFGDSVSLPLIYAATALISGLAAFDRPAWNALLPNLVPRSELGNAVRLNVLAAQMTAVLGPVLAGLALGALGPGAAYLLNALSFVPVVMALAFLRVAPVSVEMEGTKPEVSLRAMIEGLRFVRSTPLLWSSMLLDFFATFFSSALALLPVYASDILRVGEVGYGILYAAPYIGATLGALIMAQYGGRLKRQGEAMLIAVAVYGAATIVFGLSTSFLLALIALTVTGFADAISTAVRNALRQLLTPDRLRGRMLSINMIFFMGGPQLGEFEAGLVAQAFGAPFSVVSGGIGTLIVVAAIAHSVPALRTYRETAAIAAGD